MRLALDEIDAIKKAAAATFGELIAIDDGPIAYLGRRLSFGDL